MIKAVTVRINILSAPEPTVRDIMLPGGIDWLRAKQQALRAVEDTFDKLSYCRAYQVMVERDEQDGTAVFPSCEEP